MRKVVIGAAILLAGAAVLAHGAQTSLRTNNIWLSKKGFDQLEGFENALILNTKPRMIMAKKQGETMLCPMPATPGGHCPRAGPPATRVIFDQLESGHSRSS